MSNKITLKHDTDIPRDKSIDTEFTEENLTIKDCIFQTVVVEDSTKIVQFNGLKLVEKV